MEIGHIERLQEEGRHFLDSLDEVWKHARETGLELPPLQQIGPTRDLWALGEAADFEFSLSAFLAPIRAAEKEAEEKLLDKIKEWEARVIDFLDQYIGAEQRDKFSSVLPTIDDGFNRAAKSALRPASGNQEESSYWTLSDAVKARIERLNETLKGI